MIIYPLKHAVRSLVSAPVVTLLVFAVLAVSMGATVATILISYNVLFRPLPYKAPSEIAVIQETSRTSGSVGATISKQYLDDLVSTSRSMTIGWFQAAQDTIVLRDGAESVFTLTVSPTFFDVLGVAPQTGRTAVAQDEIGTTALLS